MKHTMREYAAVGSFVYAVVVGGTVMRLGYNHPVAIVVTAAYFLTMTIFMFVWLRKEEAETTRRCSDPDCMMCERARQ